MLALSTPYISITWLCDSGVKMDTLATSPEAFPSDGRHHGNIQRFVCHGVPGGKLIITSALWLDWSQDYKATGLILTWLSANGIDWSSEMRIQLIFSSFFVWHWIGCVHVRIHKNEQESKKKMKKTADGASSSQLTTLTNWLGGKILSCGMKDTIC